MISESEYQIRKCVTLTALKIHFGPWTQVWKSLVYSKKQVCTHMPVYKLLYKCAFNLDKSYGCKTFVFVFSCSAIAPGLLSLYTLI